MPSADDDEAAAAADADSDVLTLDAATLHACRMQTVGQRSDYWSLGLHRTIHTEASTPRSNSVFRKKINDFVGFRFILVFN